MIGSFVRGSGLLRRGLGAGRRFPTLMEAISVAASLWSRLPWCRESPSASYSNFNETQRSLRVSNPFKYFYLLLHFDGIAPTPASWQSSQFPNRIWSHNSNIVIVTAKQGQSIGEIICRISGKQRRHPHPGGAGLAQPPLVLAPASSVVIWLKQMISSLHRTGEVL